MSLLVVGSLAFDSVETPFGKQDDVLGGSASYLATAASYFGPVRMVGVIGEDFPDTHLKFFQSRHIDTQGISRLPGETFRWRGKYNDNLNVAHTLETHLNVLEKFDPVLPENFRDSDFVVLGNIDPGLQRKVLQQVNKPKLVACDTMNFWIEGANESLKETLKQVDLLCINDGEARQLSGEYNLVRAARVIRAMGPDILVIKRGEYGALLFYKDEIFSAPGFPMEDVRDPTGAGDSFAGGLVGTLARLGDINGAALRQAIVAGSVLASFAVADFSLNRLRGLTTEALRERFNAFKTLTDFDPNGVPLREEKKASA